MASLRQLHVARGWSLAGLEEEWSSLQWPDFGRLDGCGFVFASSRRDAISPLGNISRYLGPMLRADAEVKVYGVPAVSHRTTVIMGLWKGPQLVRMVRRPQPPRSHVPTLNLAPVQVVGRLSPGWAEQKTASVNANPFPGRDRRYRQPLSLPGVTDDSPLSGDVIPMSAAALFTWMATVLCGLILLVIWLMEYDRDFQSVAATRLPVPVISIHALLGIGGLTVWGFYLVTDDDPLAWATVADLGVVAVLGLVMAGRWITVSRR